MIAVAEKRRILIKLFSFSIPNQINRTIIGNVVIVIIYYNNL